LSETEQTTNLTVAPRLTAQTKLDPSARLFLANLRAVGCHHMNSSVDP
jgi:hypothetical protein